MEFLQKFLQKFSQCSVGRRRKFSHSYEQTKRPKSLIDLGLLNFYGPLRNLIWWSWGESNPRPKAIAGQIYALS